MASSWKSHTFRERTHKHESQRALTRDDSNTRTQIFGVEHPDDAVAVAAAGVDHLGFCPAEDPALCGFQACIAAAAARALFRELPDRTATVLLFATADENLVLRTTEAAAPDFVQVCWAVDSLGPEREARLRERLRPVRWIKEIPVGGPQTRAAALGAAERYASCADLLILDTHADRDWIGATGLVHDWSISAEIVRSAPIPCILAGGLDAGNLRDALEAVEPWGVDSYSRTNLPSLRKDLDKVRAFVEVTRRFDAERQHRA
jgi:phosphoribosylanthranilate isomerase